MYVIIIYVVAFSPCWDHFLIHRESTSALASALIDLDLKFLAELDQVAAMRRDRVLSSFKWKAKLSLYANKNPTN